MFASNVESLLSSVGDEVIDHGNHGPLSLLSDPPNLRGGQDEPG